MSFLTLATSNPAAPCAPSSPCPAGDAPRSARLETLRNTLRRRFPAALAELESHARSLPDAPAQTRADDEAVRSRLLPADGLPRGRITEWACARSGGSATLLRVLVRDALFRGEAVALVDAGHSLAAADWVAAARAGSLTVVRPPAPEDGLFCAELLLGAGAFGLVVLDGVGLPPRFAPRLAHRVREAGCAFLVVLPREESRGQQVSWQDQGPREGSGAPLRIALAPWPAAPRAAARRPGLPLVALPRIVASLVKGGAPGRLELCCAVPTSDRLCAHPLVPDRRGGARHGRSW